MHSFIKVLALLGKSACTFVGKCVHSLYIGHNDVMGYFSYNVDSPRFISNLRPAFLPRLMFSVF